MSPSTAPTVRIIGVIRQSRTHDHTISPEIQQTIIENWVDALNKSSRDGTRHEIVHWAIDLDVSAGTTSPMERPELGKWLTDEAAQNWDMLVSWKLDRLCRSALDFALLVKWLEERNKTLACTNDPIDLSTPIGRAVAQIQAIIAEMELENTKARAKENQHNMRLNGKWGGGRIPFGRKKDESDENGRLIIDEEMFPVFQGILQDIEAGKSVGSIALSLTNKGVPTAMDRQRQLKGKHTRGEAWTGANLWKMLRNRHLIGQKEYKGAIIRDDNGEPVIFMEPLMTVPEWVRLQQLLDLRATAEGQPRRNTTLLRKVGFCGVCKLPINTHQTTKRDGKKNPLRYRCASHTRAYNGTLEKTCGNKPIKASDLEGFLETVLLSQYGDDPHVEFAFVPGEDHTEEVKILEENIATLRAEKERGLFPGTLDEYLNQLESLMERRKTLLSLPAQPSGYRPQPTGKTVREHWSSLDVEGKNALLIRMNVKLFYDRRQDKPVIHLHADDFDAVRRIIQGEAPGRGQTLA